MLSSHAGLGISEVIVRDLSPSVDWLAVAGIRGKVRLIRLKGWIPVGPLIAQPNVTNPATSGEDRPRGSRTDGSGPGTL
jgi:hypothetical protein